jgi:hypothetical protein
VAGKLWAAHPVAKAPPEPGETGRRWGQAVGEVRKGGKGGRGRRRADGTTSRSPPAACGVGGSSGGEGGA